MRLVPAGLVLLSFGSLPVSAAEITGASLPPGATARLGDGRDAVRALAVAPDGTTVAVARGAAVGLFRPGGAAVRTLAGHQRPVAHLAYAPTDPFLATAAEPGDPAPLRLWDPATGELLRRWGDAGRKVRDVAFAPDGQTLAVLEAGALTLHNPRGGRFVGSLPLPEGANDFGRLAVSPDGRLLVVGGAKAERLVWDLASRRLLGCCPTPGPCRGLHFLADGRRLLWVDGDDLRVGAPAADGNHMESFAQEILSGVTATALSRDGRLLAVAQGREVAVWEVTPPRPLLRRDGHRAAVRALAFTPDGGSLVSGDDAGEALVWKITPGE